MPNLATLTRREIATQPSITPTGMANTLGHSEGTVEPRRIEGSGLDARPGQHWPDPPGAEIQRAEPVTEDPNANPCSRPLRERFGELEPHLVSMNDLTLERIVRVAAAIASSHAG